MGRDLPGSGRPQGSSGRRVRQIDSHYPVIVTGASGGAVHQSHIGGLSE